MKFPLLEIQGLDGPFRYHFLAASPRDEHEKKVELQSRPATYAGISEDKDGVNLV